MSAEATGQKDPVPFDTAEQQVLGDLAPRAGERWRNRGSGAIVTVLEVEQRAKAWVRIRVGGRESTIQVSSLLRSFTRL